MRLPDKLQLYKTQRRRKYRQTTHRSVPISWRSNAGLKPHHVIAPKPSTIAPWAEFPVSSKPYAAFLCLDWLEPNEWMQKYSNLTKLANFLIRPPSLFDSNRHAQFNASHDASWNCIFKMAAQLLRKLQFVSRNSEHVVAVSSGLWPHESKNDEFLYLPLRWKCLLSSFLNA